MKLAITHFITEWSHEMGKYSDWWKSACGLDSPPSVSGYWQFVSCKRCLNIKYDRSR